MILIELLQNILIKVLEALSMALGGYAKQPQPQWDCFKTLWGSSRNDSNEVDCKMV